MDDHEPKLTGINFEYNPRFVPGVFEFLPMEGAPPGEQWEIGRPPGADRIRFDLYGNPYNEFNLRLTNYLRDVVEARAMMREIAIRELVIEELTKQGYTVTPPEKESTMKKPGKETDPYILFSGGAANGVHVAAWAVQHGAIDAHYYPAPDKEMPEYVHVDVGLIDPIVLTPGWVLTLTDGALHGWEFSYGGTDDADGKSTE